ncbi:hypothetical protein [Rhodohalobacter mucosus]|uniref:Uncharacterized protein n=1 Tax=Rhodohalobacter mucosus TaxID=2079485 RepID=A0A316TT62_9BACT|nr:hypothetical protein [Rhodohalobacter mucosus]PWN05442.1 hypothetical protein DDZ15_15365 [Rhodohalobacter mucosus]
MGSKIGFLAGGALAVVAAFSLAFLFQNLWAGFFSAFAVAVLWLWMLDRKMISRLKDTGNRTAVRVILILLTGLMLSLSVIHYQRSEQQNESLTNIRTTIIHSISRMEMEKSLQLVLRHYHSLPAEEQTTLADAFRDLYEERLNDDGSWSPEIPDEDGDLNFTYSIASPDSVVLALTTTFTRGEDPQFLNTNNQTGLYQARAVLTERGVRYEREN